MKFIHVLLMLALIAGGYFIRDVVEPTKEAQAGIDNVSRVDFQTNQALRYAIHNLVLGRHKNLREAHQRRSAGSLCCFTNVRL
jgi:hypothetical protein